MRLSPLAVRSPCFYFEIQRNCSADEISKGPFVDFVALMNVDRASDIRLQAGVEETGRVLQRSSLGKCHLDDALITLGSANYAVVREDGSARPRRLDPFPLFNDFRICCMYD